MEMRIFVPGKYFGKISMLHNFQFYELQICSCVCLSAAKAKPRLKQTNKTMFMYFSFRENSAPTENDSHNCDPGFCQSTSSSQVDQCTNITARSD